jgi:hypothetical protein
MALSARFRRLLETLLYWLALDGISAAAVADRGTPT